MRLPTGIDREESDPPSRIRASSAEDSIRQYGEDKSREGAPSNSSRDPHVFSRFRWTQKRSGEIRRGSEGERREGREVITQPKAEQNLSCIHRERLSRFANEESKYTGEERERTQWFPLSPSDKKL